MGVMSDRNNIRARLKLYVILGNKEVIDISRYLLDNFNFYIEDSNYVIEINVAKRIQKILGLECSKKELLQYIWDKNLTSLYPLNKDEYTEVVDEIINNNDCPL